MRRRLNCADSIPLCPWRVERERVSAIESKPLIGHHRKCKSLSKKGLFRAWLGSRAKREREMGEKAAIRSDLRVNPRERERGRELNRRFCFLIREYSAMCVSIGWVNLSVSVERETGGERMRTKRWYLYGGYGYVYTSSSLRPLHVAWAVEASLVCSL